MLKKLPKTRFTFFRFFIVFFALSLFVFSITHSVFASTTVGTIDSNYKYAWGENIGWINFGCDNCKVQVTDSGLSGNAWSSQYGWINLSPSTSGVKNDGQGILSGDAWSSNLGWIDFNGVTINPNGDFLGYATIKSDSSRINFNCLNGDSCAAANFKVNTDWRPMSGGQQGGGGGNGGNGIISTSGGYSPIPTLPIIPQIPPVLPPTLPPVITPPIASIPNDISNAANSFSDFFLNFFRPKNNNQKPSNLVQVPKNAPLALSNTLNLLPVNAIHSFVFAPLPYQIRTLASKFPELAQTFKSVGVNRMTDMSKLINSKLNIPGLAERINETIRNIGVEKLNDINNINGVALDLPGFSNINENLPTGVGVGKIAMVEGLPLANFTFAEKKNLPSEFVFARTAGELVDLNVALSFNQDGTVSQKIASLPGQKLRLVVKPISKARSVTGYFAFQSGAPKISENTISRASLSASAIFGMNGLVAQSSAPVPVEKKLILSSFEYTDPDHDGIYTADVVAPGVPGSYEIITVIDYVDPELGVRKMSMTTVVDPEGYVYEKNGSKETRIPKAIVTLNYLNPTTKKYELWSAEEFSQKNPQVTDVSGTYAFLVPPGSYYFSVVAPGYKAYKGESFTVDEGGGIHENIELTSSRGWLLNLIRNLFF